MNSYSAETAMVITGLHGLASSPTAGWGSGYVDNTTNLYDDIELDIVLAFAATAPANSKAVWVFAYGGTNITDLGTTGAATGGTPGTEGALTFPDLSTNPCNFARIGTINYLASGVTQKRTFALAPAFGFFLPAYWGIAIVDHTGAAIAASGSAINWRGVKR